jgi:hypothetical protein
MLMRLSLPAGVDIEIKILLVVTPRVETGSNGHSTLSFRQRKNGVAWDNKNLNVPTTCLLHCPGDDAVQARTDSLVKIFEGENRVC